MQTTWPDSFYVTYGYDTVGELASILLSGGTTLTTFSYDDLGRRTSLCRGGMASTTDGGACPRAGPGGRRRRDRRV